MQILDNIFKNFKPLYPIEKFCKVEEILYIDIETTGLSKEKTSLYLIGCGFYKDNDFHTKLFFADDPSEELLIIEKFRDFSKDFSHLIHFNGTKFDIPYLKYKTNKYELPDLFENMQQIDVYQLCKPLRYLLFPSSMRQKCIEDFLKITRDDKYNGGELIAVYHSYVANRSEKDFELLITHNLEDVLGMHKIMPILYYLELKDETLSYITHEILSYKDYAGNEKEEMLITFKSNKTFPESFTSKTETLYLNANCKDSTFKFRLEIHDNDMKLFYDNYKDYYYLPSEDTCIHKSVAMGLNKNQYQKATKDTCYSRITGKFIKQPGNIFTPVLKDSYKSKSHYFKYPDSFDSNKLDEFGTSLLQVFFNKR